MQISCKWEVKKRNATGLYEVQLTRYNIWTNYGLSALARCRVASHTLRPSTWLSRPTVIQLPILAGSPPVQPVVPRANPMESGDTQIILSVGTANQETVTAYPYLRHRPVYLQLPCLHQEPCIR